MMMSGHKTDGLMDSDLNPELGVVVSPGDAVLMSAVSDGVPLAESPPADVGVDVSDWKRGRKKT